MPGRVAPKVMVLINSTNGTSFISINEQFNSSPQFNHMKKLTLNLGLFALVSSFSSCEMVGDIFSAGMWVGVLIVVAVIALIIWLVGRGRR